MSAEWTAFLAVAWAEVADKSMLASISLGAYFHAAPGVRWPLLRTALGYFAAVLLNHALTVALGRHLSPWLFDRGQLLTGLSLLLCAWLLWRDGSEDPRAGHSRLRRRSPLLTTFLVVSLAELFDKTQLVTAAMAVGHPQARILAATVGAMLCVGVPAIVFGSLLEPYLAAPRVRWFALATLTGVGSWTILDNWIGT